MDRRELKRIIKSFGDEWYYYYDFDGIEKLYPTTKYRYERKNFKKMAGAKKDQAQTESTEVLIMNY